MNEQTRQSVSLIKQHLPGLVRAFFWLLAKDLKGYGSKIMRQAFILLFVVCFLAGCSNNASNEEGAAQDTMTNITNPGVGAASDDTTAVNK